MAWVAPWSHEDCHPGISWILMEVEEDGDWPQYLCSLLVLLSLFLVIQGFSTRTLQWSLWVLIVHICSMSVAMGMSHELKLREKEGQWGSCLMPTGLLSREERGSWVLSLGHHFLIYSEVAGPPGTREMFHKWLHLFLYFLFFFPLQNTFSFAQPSSKILAQGSFGIIPQRIQWRGHFRSSCQSNFYE